MTYATYFNMAHYYETKAYLESLGIEWDTYTEYKFFEAYNNCNQDLEKLLITYKVYYGDALTTDEYKKYLSYMGLL